MFAVVLVLLMKTRRRRSIYYRYEAKDKNGEWIGIFAVMNPSQRRFFGRTLHEPKWYKTRKNVKSRCWFTEDGYNKYKVSIEMIITEMRQLHPELETRCIQVESLNIV